MHVKGDYDSAREKAAAVGGGAFAASAGFGF